MDALQSHYKGEFTIEERKAMTAKMLHDMRKQMKLSQKEVAAHINIPATTYNTYESGRTEPPIEIMVRLSHLYGVPIDLIVQRDRTYRDADDLSRVIAEQKGELAELEKAMAEKGLDDPNVMALLAAVGKLTEAMESYSQTEEAKKAL